MTCPSTIRSTTSDFEMRCDDESGHSGLHCFETDKGVISWSPKRIQRKRSKGWQMPEGAVYVGRPTKWGNPFSDDDLSTAQVIVESPQEAVTMYREHVAFRCALDPVRWDIAELRGRDLACWCPLVAPCHADVLLEIANQVQVGEPG